MLDAELQIVDSAVIDISSATSFTSTAVQLNRRAFPDKAAFVIHIEDTSADNTVDPVRFDLEVSVDGGTTFHKVANIELKGNGSLSLGGPYEVPIGPMDWRAEMRSTTEVQVRVVVNLNATGAADDFTYSAYLGTVGPYPHFSNAAVYHE